MTTQASPRPPKVFSVDERGLPRMETGRLILRVASVRDLDAMVRFRNDNRDHVARWEPARHEDYYRDVTWRARIAENERDAEVGTNYGFVLTLREAPREIIGVANLRDIIHYFCQSATLGYSIDRRYEGRGLMTEALHAVLWFAFNQLGLHRIEACYMPANGASARVLEKLGFEIEGRLRKSLLVAGKWEDHILTSLISEPKTERSQ